MRIVCHRIWAFMILSLGFLFLSGVAMAQVPRTINFQGVLSGTDGNVVADGTYSVTFALYDAAIGGGSKFTEVRSVMVQDGIFSVILGTPGNGIDLPFDRPYWLGLSVGSEPEMTPRITFSSVPYSFQSRSVLGEANVFPSDGAVVVQGDLRLPELPPDESPSKILTQDDGDEIRYVSLAALASLIQVSGESFSGVLVDTPLVVQDGDNTAVHTLASDGTSSHSGLATYSGGLQIPSGNTVLAIEAFGLTVYNPGTNSLLYSIDRSGNTSQAGQFRLDGRMQISESGELDFENASEEVTTSISSAGLWVDILGGAARLSADVNGLNVGLTDGSGPYFSLNEDGESSHSKRASFDGGIRMGADQVIGFTDGTSLTTGDFDGQLTGQNLRVEDSVGNPILRTSQEGVFVEKADGTDIVFVNTANENVSMSGNLDVSGYAFIHGALTVDGGVSASVKSFQIDHPLDPENRYLRHASIESSEMKNLYDGVVRLDRDGEAWIVLPDWFDALNDDFRYQLTPIGASAPALFIMDEIAERRFRIAGGPPGLKVSWQVTGVRHDRYALENPLRVEVNKPRPAHN